MWLLKRTRYFFTVFLHIAVLLIGPLNHVDGQEQYHYRLQDLKSEWKVYSREENALVPYIESVNTSSNTIHIPINQEDYLNNGIHIIFKRESAVFINNQLAFSTQYSQEKVFTLDSLKDIYGPGKIIMTIFVQEGISDLETYLVSFSEKNPALLESIDHLPIEGRDNSPIWDFMKLGILIILIFYVILFNIGGRTFSDYYNILNSFVRIGADDFLDRTKKISRIDLVFILVLSIVISFFIVIIAYHYKISSEGFYSLSLLFLKWLWFFLILLIWVILRFSIISISSDLFKMRGIGTVHIFEYLRITNFYSLFIFFLLLILLFVLEIDLSLFSTIVLHSIIVISVLRAILLYMKFLNSTDFSKLYLFAYLCSAELLPVIVGLKFLLKSSLLHPIM